MKSKLKVDTGKSSAIITGVNTFPDFTTAIGKLSKKFGNRDILYIFTTPDGEAIIIIFK